MRVALGFLRGLIWAKRSFLRFGKALIQPFSSVGLVLLKVIGVPVYRGIFLVRRTVDQVLLPAKHKFFYLLSNRYSIHAFMILLVAAVGIVNIQTQNVRAETFGQRSILYAMVSPDDSGAIEVVVAGKSALLPGGGESSYLADTVLDQRTQMGLGGLDAIISDSSAPSPSAAATARTRVETYMVQTGDTLGRIAVKFGLSISTLLSSNDLTLRSTIRPGDTLKILPKDGVMYTVKSGDTLSKIATRYSIDASLVASENQLSLDSPLRIGTAILLPGATEIAQTPSAIARKPVTVKDVITSPVSSSDKQVSKSGWIWPTNLRTITQYYGWSHTGIDIAANYSTYSMAAKDGVVTYVGWRNGYGLTVELDHGGGYKTRYAHNSKILVGVGDVVMAGTRLAVSGSTGNSTGPHLHFEIMINGKFQNPLSYVR